MPVVSLIDLESKIAAALSASGASSAMAGSTAKALAQAEAQGIGSHGLGRVAQYCAQLRNGRVNGQAKAAVLRAKGAALLVDAQQGLAFPACDLAIQEAIRVAKEQGVCFVGVTNSHHCGVLIDHLRAAGAAGLVGLGFANSPAAMPAPGGRHPIFGTNPIAALFPRRSGEHLMIDFSLSEVARGKVMVAAKEGRSIPLGWALDGNGEPTTDAKAALEGSMLPIGSVSSVKGGMLALIVELLVTALIGAQFGYEADSFFVDEGNAPRIGQSFLLIDPGALAGQESYQARIEVLINEMLVDDGVRLAGQRREKLLQQAMKAGVDVAQAQLDLMARLAQA